VWVAAPREEIAHKMQGTSSDGSPARSRVVNPLREIQLIKQLAEVAVMVALSGALYAVKIFTLPQGGSITLASMVPVFLLALRRGPKWGIAAGVIFGLVAMVEDLSTGAEVIIYPAQVIFDYPLAFGLLGLAGFFRKTPLLGVGIGVAARFCSHFVSGILFFASFAPAGMSPYEYSAIYNGSFLLPEMVITAIIMVGLVRLKALQLYL
jgi:thiamine transporter